MASFDFLSVIQYDRTGNSINFKNTGDFSTQSGTLDDGETFADDGAVGDTFESGDSFTFNVTPAIADDFPDYNSGDIVTLDYVGTYTINGVTGIVLEDQSDPNIGFVFSPADAASTNAALPNVINTGDPEFDAGAYTPCFLIGSLIATPDGEKPVESLDAGDLVLNSEGQPVPVKWLGRRTIAAIFRPAEELSPVRFAAGSLGKGLPHSDLTVTANHAMLLDGVLCHASALVNGSTIVRVPLEEMGQTFTTYHVETENHEIILANGAPTETFIDNVSRRIFHNFSEFEKMYGEVRDMAELPYPRAMSARQLPASVRQLISREDAA
ncbi:Hint domain-containing protein [Falsiphaeobacter marinintestinus]|uniref:Hint domain-containing protein n=1 Tax=Falsiphaeobacter marinintestinus TaxID=1492905 RepID=UPI0011B613E2|nr:Hint domain-containing protein [Phaeobacter marinintestinus]